MEAERRARGLAGEFNADIVKAAICFSKEKAALDLGLSEALPEDGGAGRMRSQVKRIEIEAIGRRGRDLLRRRFPTAEPDSRERGIYVNGELVSSVDLSGASQLSQRIIDRYTRREIHSVYLAFNEFKSVIAPRVLVNQAL